MLIPLRVVARLTEPQRRLVTASASGNWSKYSESAVVIPLWTSAEKPPTKSTPMRPALSSTAFASRM
jgi:hypothetical protein